MVGRYHGRGRYEWSDGSFYEGEYQADRQHGRGVRLFSNGGKRGIHGDYSHI